MPKVSNLPPTSSVLRLLCAGAMHGVIDALDATFAGIAGKPVAASFANSGGVKARVMAGESADVAISTAAAIDELARHGKVLTATATAVARSPIGVAVRAGAREARHRYGRSLQTRLRRGEIDRDRRSRDRQPERQLSRRACSSAWG